MSDENDAPRVNGTPESSDTDLDAAKLETFRKQAIYRRMKHYSRENERKRAYIESLQQRNRNSEEGLKALVSCWTQLVNTVHSLCPSASVIGQEPHPPAVYDIITRRSDQQRLAEVQATVENSVKATRALVTKFLASSEHGPSSSQREAFYQCQTKCGELEVECLDTKRKLDEATDLLQTRESELEVVQSRYERLMMSRKQEGVPVAPSPMGDTPEPPANDVDAPMQDLTHTAPELATQHMQEAEWLDMQAALNKTIEHLKREISRSTEDVKQLQAQLAQIPESRIHQTSTYIELKHAANFYEQALKKVRQENAELMNTVKTLTQEKATYQDIAKTAAESMEQDYQAKLEKRSAECSRLRAERDQARAALRERELKDGPLPSIAQLEALQKSQDARLDVSRSETKRLQARLAEQAGNTELLRFLFPNYTPEKADYAEHLQKRVQELEAQISQLQESNLPADVAQLAEMVKERGAEIIGLKEREAMLRESLTAAETDLNLVSSAYDDSEKQLKDKIFTLLERDKALQEAQHLRLKAEQRYIATQSEKDSKEAERVAALRAKEALEQVLSSKDSLISSLRSSQREATLSITSLKHTIMELENTRIEGDSQLQRKEDECTMEKDNFFSALGKLMQRESQIVQRETTLLERSEALGVEKRRMERERRLLDADKMRASKKKLDPDSHMRLMEKELTDLKNFAKCKCCGDHYRTKVITTCMHTFCKDCIEDRIASRQRACMTCGLKFSQSEVKDLYY